MATALTIAGPSPFSRVWTAYERSLRRRPVLTQAVSSALLWGLGDAMAQRIETRGRVGVDARRVALTAAFGGTVIGPAGHGWYLLLESLVQRLGLACSMKSMLLKVTVDNLIFSPCYVLAFFAFGCMVIDGLSPSAFVEKMREEFVPTMLAEAMVWPPYMAAVFSKVPVKHQLLAVNVATLFDVCFLSWVRKHEEAGTALISERPQPAVSTEGRRARRGKAVASTLEPPPPPLAPRSLGGGGDSDSAQPLPEKLLAVAGAAAVALAAAMHAAFHFPEPNVSQATPPAPRTIGEARRAELAAGLWDMAPEPSLGRMALMTASATCSTGGGSRLRVSSGVQAAAGIPSVTCSSANSA